MGAGRVLFIGGTGRISWWCVDAAVRRGFDVHVLNRGETGIRPLPREVRRLKGSARDRASVTAAVKGLAFDCVVNFVAYDAKDGRILWHARIGNVSNAPQTYLIDGRQHVLVAAGDALFAFALRE